MWKLKDDIRTEVIELIKSQDKGSRFNCKEEEDKINSIKKSQLFQRKENEKKRSDKINQKKATCQNMRKLNNLRTAC